MKRKSSLINCFNSLYCIILISVIASCKQDEVKYLEIATTRDVKIEKLKVYLSDFTNADIAKVSYDSTKKVFLINGKELISRIELEELYGINPNINYKDGMPVSGN